jgi:hypothetical protein
MDKLTDLEICKRIAEIEGAKETLYSYSSFNTPKELTAVFDSSTVFNYNPLTDDALCFKLMVKYKISLIQHQNNTAVYCIWDHDEKHATNTMWNANRAICLAIIKSKE